MRQTKRRANSLMRSERQVLPRSFCSSEFLLLNQTQFAAVQRARGGFLMTQRASEELTTEAGDVFAAEIHFSVSLLSSVSPKHAGCETHARYLLNAS